MAKSLKKNFALNLTNTLVGLLFPIVTFPYVSRVIMPDGIGIVQFFQSIINYVVLLSALGIPLYAVREIARVRDNVEERNKTTVEILLLHTFLSVIGYGVVFILGFTVERISASLGLYLLLSLHILLNVLGLTWFYQAVEDFSYITIRNTVVRLLSAIALFTLVQDARDLYIYAGILVAAEAGGNLFNFFHLRKYVRFDRKLFSGLKIFRHLGPSLRIFVLNLIISIYVNLDSVMLGFLSTDASVGYYSAATRITKALLGVVQSLGAVLLPRFTHYISNGMYSEFRSSVKSAVDFVITLSLPLSVGLMLVSEPLIQIFCGAGFAPAAMTLRIISPIILFIGVSNILGIQVLYSQGKEHLVMISTASGAVLNFMLNWLLIPHMAQDGAAVATVIAEFSVTAVMIVIGRKYIPYRFLSKSVAEAFVMTVLMAIVLFFINKLHLSAWMLLLLSVSVGAAVCVLMLSLTRNELMLRVIGMLRRTNSKHGLD